MISRPWGEVLFLRAPKHDFVARPRSYLGARQTHMSVARPTYWCAPQSHLGTRPTFDFSSPQNISRGLDIASAIAKRISRSRGQIVFRRAPKYDLAEWPISHLGARQSHISVSRPRSDIGARAKIYFAARPRYLFGAPKTKNSLRSLAIILARARMISRPRGEILAVANI